jgi:hypothetical protein
MHVGRKNLRVKAVINLPEVVGKGSEDVIPGF